MELATLQAIFLAAQSRESRPNYGWKAAFLSLAGVAFFTAVVALVLVVVTHIRESVETEVEAG